MDPFSIVAGAAGLADVSWRIIKYLKSIQTAATEVQEEIFSLIREVNALTTVNNAIRSAFEAELNDPPDPDLPKSQHLQSLWQQTGDALTNSKDLIETLNKLVHAIYGGKGPETVGKLDGFLKAERKRSKKDALHEIREQLLVCQNRLQIVLLGVNVWNQRNSHDTLDRIKQQLSSWEQDYDSRILALENTIHSTEDENKDELDKVALASLQQLRASIHSVTAAITAASINKHFDIPQRVSSIYTGREDYLRRLKEIFFTAIRSIQQKRFVIQGVGGSGKTQFCSKFAQDNRDMFWGVFWIDASSHERAKQTFAQIATIGEVEPNEVSVLHWLSNLDEKWLLIIDNADDPSLDLERYFPSGDRGHVLITTRNPAHKVHGNTGPGFFEFHFLEYREANALLLRAAQQPEPWDRDTSTWASIITKKLGFLALALTQAGAAIRSGLCTLKNYLHFYDENWNRVRSMRALSKDSSEELAEYMSVYATYEVSFRAIEEKGTQSSQDAVQLLKMFAFFYYEDIRVDILKRAMTNKKVEDNAEEDAAENSFQQSQGWADVLNAMRMWTVRFISKDRNPPPLPSLIRDARASGDIRSVRLSYALRELIRTSLISYNESKDRYSMHPLVHKWARERPEMRTAEQALWAHVAAVTIGHSILIPPLGGSEDDERFHRDLLPHVDHVCESLTALQSCISTHRKSSWLAWLLPQANFSRDVAVRSVKFSLVYAHGGRWKEAEALQRAVKDYLHRAMGPRYLGTRRIMLVLADTLWNLGRSDEAAELQESVLEACTNFLGRKHEETLSVMNKLGQTRWQQGRYTDAQKLQEEAVASLVKMKGYEDEKTLIAMDDLGRTLAKFYTDLERAKTLHVRAVEGMKKALGPEHSRTLIAIENLAALEVQMDGNTALACAMMEEVLSIRKKTLGKEHPYTLLAMANLARVKTAHGEYQNAESILRRGISIAERTLGAGHVGSLMGRTILGTVLIRQGRLAEAERELLDVSELQRHISDSRGDVHPDRIGTMIELTECYKLQCKYDRSLRYCQAAIDGLAEISVRDHPLAVRIRLEKDKLLHLRDLAAL